MSFISITPPVNQHGLDNILRLCKTYLRERDNKLNNLDDAVMHLSDWSPSVAGLFFMTQTLLMTELLVKQRAMDMLVELDLGSAKLVVDVAEFILNDSADYAVAATQVIIGSNASIAIKGVCQ